MNIKKILGKRIQEIRKKKKLTQEKVAELIGIETTSLSNIENGKYYPTAENLDKIISVLEITPQKLFSFEHLQDNEEIKKEILNILETHPEKLQIIYKIIRVLID